MEVGKLEANNFKIAIASGKGGTGKTFLSTSLFSVVSKHYKDVVIVDSDAEEPNSGIFFDKKLVKEFKVTQKVPVINTEACTFCGLCHDYCAYNAIFIIPPSKIIKVIDELCHGCGACSYACKFDALTEKDVEQGIISKFKLNGGETFIESRMKVGVMSPVKVIKAGLKEAGNKGIVIFDAPPGTSCPFIQTVTNADYIILITEPTPFGLSDLKQSIDTLKTMNKNYGVVINRAGLGNDEVYKFLEENKIPLLMEIPFNREIAGYYSKAKIAADFMPDLSESLLKMFDVILKEYGNSNN